MRVAVCLTVLLAFTSVGHASMPAITEKPTPASLQACQTWAGQQNPDAIDMWGVQEAGGTSRDIAISRLTALCMGDQPPAIVGFGSSVGFDDNYCKEHPSAGVCARRDTQKKDSTDVSINKPGTLDDVSFCKGDMVLSPGTLVGTECMHFRPLNVVVVGTSGSKLIVSFTVDDGPTQTMLADQAGAKLTCDGQGVAVADYLAGKPCGAANPKQDDAKALSSDYGTMLMSILKLQSRDPNSDDCVVRGTIDYASYASRLSDFRETFLNKEHSTDFYFLRKKSLFLYYFAKREAAMITDSLYNRNKAGDCHFSLDVSYTDNFGQKRSFEGVTWRFTDAQSQKVNWENVDPGNFETIALDFKLTAKAINWLSDENIADEDGKQKQEPACDMTLFNANAIFMRATGTVCRKNYMDSKAGLIALEGTRKCVMSEGEFRQKAKSAILDFDHKVRQFGRKEICGAVEELSRKIESRKE